MALRLCYTFVADNLKSVCTVLGCASSKDDGRSAKIDVDS